MDSEYDKTSYIVDLTGRDLHGLGQGLKLRRHRNEDISNEAIDKARRDWHDWIGPIDTFANANPYDGNFTALTLPFTKKERFGVVSYFMEYAFLYDDVNESAAKALEMAKNSGGMIVEDGRSAEGAKKMQAKMIDELLQIDHIGGQRILDKWKVCVEAVRETKKGHEYTSLEEYIELRSKECGAPFVEALMLFGMDLHLSTEEDQLLAPIAAPAYATLGLANDYFSFDREYSSHNTDSEPMTNAVWLCMQWHNIAIEGAKAMILLKAQKYERNFINKKKEFLLGPKPESRLVKCLDGLEQMIIGNIVWSLRCPRYHPEMRYDANAGVENKFLGREPSVEEVRAAVPELAENASARAMQTEFNQ